MTSVLYVLVSVYLYILVSVYASICNQESFLGSIIKPHMSHCLILNHVTTVLTNHNFNIYTKVWDFTQKYFHLNSKNYYNGYANKHI